MIVGIRRSAGRLKKINSGDGDRLLCFFLPLLFIIPDSWPSVGPHAVAVLGRELIVAHIRSLSANHTVVPPAIIAPRLGGEWRSLSGDIAPIKVFVVERHTHRPFCARQFSRQRTACASREVQVFGRTVNIMFYPRQSRQYNHKALRAIDHKQTSYMDIDVTGEHRRKTAPCTNDVLPWVIW